MRHQYGRASAVIMTALALSAAGLGAQSPRATAMWFGVPLPPAAHDPHQAVVDVTKAEPPVLRLPAGDIPDADMGGPRIRKDVEAIVGFAKQSRAAGDRVWGRVTGLPAAARTIEWTAQQFTTAGLADVAVQKYSASAPMWWSRSWAVRLVGDPAFGAGTTDVVLSSALPTSGSHIEHGTLTASVVHIGSVTEPVPHVDVKGKIAVQHLKPASGAYSDRGRVTERARAMQKRGAVAVLNVIEQTGNMHIRDFGNCGVPCFNVGAADGAFLEAVMQHASAARVLDQLRLHLQLQDEMLEGLTGQNALGIVPPRNHTSVTAAENIIVNAHADGWFDAAGDNADGLAVLVALARHFAKPENRLDRTLVFVASGGHHSTGLNGPANFVNANAGLTSKTVLVLNLEHVAQLLIRSDGWTVESKEQPMSFGISNQSPFLIALGRRAMERYAFNLNPTFGANVPGDLGGYAPLNVARVQAIHSGPMYHTSGDVLETISVPGLERAARFFAYFIREAAKAARTELNPSK
jgi:hypothetical protein